MRCLLFFLVLCNIIVQLRVNQKKRSNLVHVIESPPVVFLPVILDITHSLLRLWLIAFILFFSLQGTASVVLAGLLASQNLTGRKLSDERILCYGSGEAAIGFSHLVTRALTRRFGMTEEQAKEHLFLVDSKGLVVKDRKTGGLTSHKLEFARPAGTPELTSLEEVSRFAVLLKISFCLRTDENCTYKRQCLLTSLRLLCSTTVPIFRGFMYFVIWSVN